MVRSYMDLFKSIGYTGIFCGGNRVVLLDLLQATRLPLRECEPELFNKANLPHCSRCYYCYCGPPRSSLTRAAAKRSGSSAGLSIPSLVLITS